MPQKPQLVALIREWAPETWNVSRPSRLEFWLPHSVDAWSTCQIFGFSDCSRNAYMTEGPLESPQFPSKYPNNFHQECIIHLKGAPGSSLLVNFTVFGVESHPKCAYDHLQVSLLMDHTCSLTNVIVLGKTRLLLPILQILLQGIIVYINCLHFNQIPFC